MKLYHMPRTRSARVIWTAHEIGVDIDVQPVNLKKGEGQTAEYKARHPHGKLPAAEIGGEHIIESGAIALHLALHHKAGSTFLPDLATVRGAKVLQWAFYAAASLDDLTVNAYIQARFVPEERRQQAIIDRAASQWKETITPFLSRELGDGAYMLGEDFTFADVMLGYSMYFAGEMDWLDDSLNAYVGRIVERPGFKLAFDM